MDDSRTVDRLCIVRVLDSSEFACLLAGGRLSNGLAWRTLYEDFDIAVAGEYEVIEVAADEILKAPGESA